jgi:tRNA threonylcarbamoyladenosine biosynthesis protein TsaE
MVVYTYKKESLIDEAARWFLGNKRSAAVFAVSGEMGAGKTTFIKAICKELGVYEEVSSPSFALVYEYHSPVAGTIYHFDLYRIRELSELFDLGYEDYFFSGNLCFIEWPEIAEELLPPDAGRLKIEVNKDKSRRLILNT